MSKGHGRLQRRLLQILSSQDRPVETFVLAAAVFDVPPGPDGVCRLTDTQIVATRRALHRLAREGSVIDLGYGGRRKVWASERVGLPLKIHPMQHENAVTASGRDQERALEILDRRLDEMRPLIKRATELGIMPEQQPASI